MFGKSCHGCLLWLSVNQKTNKLASLTDKSSPEANKISFVYQPVFLFTDIPLILLIFPNLSVLSENPVLEYFWQILSLGPRKPSLLLQSS